jgi:hypothetical protein
MVTEACQYLKLIPAEDLKDTTAIERLENYSGAQPRARALASVAGHK